MKNLFNLLKVKDPELWSDLVNPFTLLFCIILSNLCDFMCKISGAFNIDFEN